MNVSKNYGTFIQYYAAETKKELLPFVTAWMELQRIMLSEISQAVRDKYHIISLITGTNQQNKQASKILPDIEIKNNLTGTRGEVGRDSGRQGERVFRNTYK